MGNIKEEEDMVGFVYLCFKLVSLVSVEHVRFTHKLITWPLCLLLDLSHRLEKDLALCRICHHQWISTGAPCHCLSGSGTAAQGAKSQLECARLRGNSEVAFETISLPGVHPYPSCPSGGSLRSPPLLPTCVGQKEINYMNTEVFIWPG